MSRLSQDELAEDGTIRNGYDYNLQVWVVGGIVQPCGHSENMRAPRGAGRNCCPAWTHRERVVADIPGHEIRSADRTIWP